MSMGWDWRLTALGVIAALICLAVIGHWINGDFDRTRK